MWSGSFPRKRRMKAIGVNKRQNIRPVTMGLVILASSNPNFVQRRLNGRSACGNASETAISRPLNPSAQTRRGRWWTSGTSATTKKNAAKVRPNARFEGPSIGRLAVKFSCVLSCLPLIALESYSLSNSLVGCYHHRPDPHKIRLSRKTPQPYHSSVFQRSATARGCPAPVARGFGFWNEHWLVIAYWRATAWARPRGTGVRCGSPSREIDAD